MVKVTIVTKKCCSINKKCCSTNFNSRLMGGTVRAKISAVKGWVTKEGFHWKGGHILLKALTGVERKAPPSSFREERDPVKENHLRVLHEGLNLSGRSGFDHAISTAAKTLFTGQLRAGEILTTSPNTNEYDHSSLPLVKDYLEPPKTIDNGTLRLPKTKTHQTKGEKAVLPSQPG